MKVLFDHQIFSMQKYGGISRYFGNLHQGLNEYPYSESKLGILFTDNAYVKDEQLLPVFNRVIKKESRRYKYNKWYSRYLIKQNHFDIFHPTYYHSYFLEELKKPFVLTVHDMIHELFPQYFITDPYKDYKRKIIEKANHIIAISECTKNDIQNFYNIPDNKLSVVHHGYSMLAVSGNSKPGLIDKRYILFVGDRGGYKNFDFFIKAVAPILLKESISLICAGGGYFKDTEVQLFNKLNIIGYIQQINVDDDQLRNFYENAVAFIYPSLYEGFGLPILEAFSNKCPVVLSNTSSFPEVAGNAGEYFDPTNSSSIAFAVENVITNRDKQYELRRNGCQRLELFGFEGCLRKTLQVYHSLI